MPRSQNGWPAYNDTSHFVIGSSEDFVFWAANDDVKVIFEDLIQRFNQRVEPISGKTLDDWSWADRNVRDSDTVISNHASATAIDLNATKHPRGKVETFSQHQVSAIHAIVAGYHGVIRWGGDYVSAQVDAMHFEINANASNVKLVADELRNEYVPLTNADADLIINRLLDHKVELSDEAAKAMSSAGTKRKQGDLISLNYLINWGGAGEYRLYGMIADLQAEVNALKANSGK
jgi:hypothetical protein